PTVTVLTNTHGVVSLDRTVHRTVFDEGQRMCRKPLPSKPFSQYWDDAVRSSHGKVDERRRADRKAPNFLDIENYNPKTAKTAEGIKDSVKEALDKWSLEKSRRDSCALWRNECSRYAFTSRLGYHPNHPSASHPASRPASAPSPPQVQQRAPRKGRALSALPTRSVPFDAQSEKKSNGLEYRQQGWVSGYPSLSGQGHQTGDKEKVPPGGETRPVSAFPRLGIWQCREEDQLKKDDMGGGGALLTFVEEGRPRPQGGGGYGRVRYTGRGDDGMSSEERDQQQDQQPQQHQQHQPQEGAVQGGDDPVPVDLAEQEEDDTDIYEDLGEDDDDIDDCISILERRYYSRDNRRLYMADASNPATGRVGVASAAGGGNTRLLSLQAGPSSAPRCRAMNSGGLNSAMRSGSTIRFVQERSPVATAARVPRKIKRSSSGSRPLSAPVGRLLLDPAMNGHSWKGGGGSLGGVFDNPLAPPHIRRAVASAHRRSLEVLSAERGRGFAGATEGLRGGGGGEGVLEGVGHGGTRPRRDIVTAVPTWNLKVDGGDRPASGVTTTGAMGRVGPGAGAGAGVGGWGVSRPSSAAFQRWVEASPNAAAAVSAVSSARTLGLEDTELSYQQLELESRRGTLSEATLAQV
ncbi:unnamed protein product, partial [Discosporangium mesarthrocarpum]